MKEWIERMMHALGWVPVERERALEDALEKVRSSHGEDRAALEAFKRELIRTTASWEKAEARVRELETEFTPEERKRARMLLDKDRLAQLGEKADLIVAGRLIV